eukprot:4951820-Lingulodinium_polyedra.AAC.1
MRPKRTTPFFQNGREKRLKPMTETATPKSMARAARGAVVAGADLALGGQQETRGNDPQRPQPLRELLL